MRIMGHKLLLGNMGKLGSQGKGDGWVVGYFSVGVRASVYRGGGGGLVRKWAARERSVQRKVGGRRPAPRLPLAPDREGW